MLETHLLIHFLKWGVTCTPPPLACTGGGGGGGGGAIIAMMLHDTQEVLVLGCYKCKS